MKTINKMIVHGMLFIYTMIIAMTILQMSYTTIEYATLILLVPFALIFTYQFFKASKKYVKEHILQDEWNVFAAMIKSCDLKDEVLILENIGTMTMISINNKKYIGNYNDKTYCNKIMNLSHQKI
jgi:hypothetical protein